MGEAAAGLKQAAERTGCGELHDDVLHGCLRHSLHRQSGALQLHWEVQPAAQSSQAAAQDVLWLE